MVSNPYILFSVDATKEPSQQKEPILGRLVNHCGGPKANCKMRVTEINGRPTLCLFASKDIKANVELLYDYDLPINFHFPEPYYLKLIKQLTVQGCTPLDRDDTSARKHTRKRNLPRDDSASKPTMQHTLPRADSAFKHTIHSAKELLS